MTDKELKAAMADRVAQDLHARQVVLSQNQNQGHPDNCPWSELNKTAQEKYKTAVKAVQNVMTTTGYTAVMPMVKLFVVSIHTRLHCRRANGTEFSIAPIANDMIPAYLAKMATPVIQSVLESTPNAPDGLDGSTWPSLVNHVIMDMAHLGANLVRITD